MNTYKYIAAAELVHRALRKIVDSEADATWSWHPKPDTWNLKIEIILLLKLSLFNQQFTPTCQNMMRLNF